MNTKHSFPILTAAALFSLGLMAAPVLAAGSGSSGGNTTPGASTAPSAASLGCKKTQVVKKVKKNGRMVWGCVNRTSDNMTDEELYQQGVALAKEGYYEWALDLLTSIKNQNDPKVLNYIGYSHRKAGRIETGVAFYRKALDINPNFVLAREYLGEGYVAAGRIELAKAELAEIGKRCGVTCSEYVELQKAITSVVN